MQVALRLQHEAHEITGHQGMENSTPLSVPETELASLFPAAVRQIATIERLHPKILGKESSKPIHNFRIATRRLSEITQCILPGDSAETDQITRSLRRARRVLSATRNCDVLIEISARKLGGLHSPRQAAWREFHKYLKNRRKICHEKAVGKIRGLHLKRLCTQLRAKLQTEDVHLPDDNRWSIQSTLSRRINKELWRLWTRLKRTGQRAIATGSVPDTHAFRIAVKRFRYRLELLGASRHSNVHELLVQLKGLQDSLGRWHDQEVLQESLQEMLVRSNLLDANWQKTHQVVGLAIFLAKERAKLATECYRLAEETLKQLGTNRLIVGLR